MKYNRIKTSPEFKNISEFDENFEYLAKAIPSHKQHRIRLESTAVTKYSLTGEWHRVCPMRFLSTIEMRDIVKRNKNTEVNYRLTYVVPIDEPIPA